MTRKLCCCLLLFAIALSAQYVNLQKIHGEPLTNGLDGWTVTGQTLECVKEDPDAGLHCTTKGFSSALLGKTLDATPYAGKWIYLRAEYKVEQDIVRPPNKPWQGGKVQLNITRTNGSTMYPNAVGRTDHYLKPNGWIVVEKMISVPLDVKELNWMIGLQESEGELRIRNIELFSCERIPQVCNYRPYNLALQREPRYRGMMTGYPQNMTPEAIAVLASWNVNLIRYQIKTESLKTGTRREAFFGGLESWLTLLDKLIPECRKHGIKILIDLHRGPAQSGNSNHLTEAGEHDDILMEAWERIAKRYRGNPQIWGYDILNEPIDEYAPQEVFKGTTWQRLAEKLVKHIRQFDPDMPIIVESLDCASPLRFKDLQPIQDPKIIYSVHMYSPGGFTHQHPNGHVKYPGMIDGRQWNREALREVLQPVIDFQQKYNVPIYVGEFSAVGWGEGCGEYLDELMSLFEELGWDYTYHAFREAAGWDPELIATDWSHATRATEPTPRLKALLKYFAKNKR